MPSGPEVPKTRGRTVGTASPVTRSALRATAAGLSAAALLAGCGSAPDEQASGPTSFAVPRPSATATGSPELTGLPAVPAPEPPTAAPTDITPAPDAPLTPEPASPPEVPVAPTETSAPGDPVVPGSQPIALPTAFVPLDLHLTDPDLGHEIIVTRMVRSLPWPAGYESERPALELLAVEMTWSAGTAYTATIAAKDFSIATSSRYPNRTDPILDPSLQAAGWAQLPPEVGTGGRVSGWLVFRVEPRNADRLRLDYTRPASRVTDTGQTFPKQVFSAPLPG